MSAGPWYTSSGIGDANNAAAAAVLEEAFTGESLGNGLLASPPMRAMLADDAAALGGLTGALALKWGLVDIGTGAMAATGEGSAASATNFSVSTGTLTPARRAFARKISDYGAHIQQALLTAPIGTVTALLARDAYGVWRNSLITLVATLFGSASYTIGTSGAALTWQVLQFGVMDAVYRSGGSAGTFAAMLSKQQVQDLAADAMSLGGAVQMSAQVQQFLSQNTGGDAAYIGRFFGVVDLYMSNRLTTSGGDVIGGLFGTGAIVCRHERVMPLPGGTPAFDAGFFSAEWRARNGDGTATIDFIAHNAVAIKQSLALAKIQTRAS
jgi:hypothetical protein